MPRNKVVSSQTWGLELFIPLGNFAIPVIYPEQALAAFYMQMKGREGNSWGRTSFGTNKNLVSFADNDDE
jgi:hypothetical protein